MTTLDLKEAAAFLKIHPETMRQMALAKKVHGTKIGRRWVFLQEHLVQLLTGDYPKQGGLRLVVNNSQEQTKWQSTKEKTTERTTGISTSSAQTASEYDALLAPKTNKQRKNFTTV
jgi:hypothetical protein